jgi:hypothetical protein
MIQRGESSPDLGHDMGTLLTCQARPNTHTVRRLRVRHAEVGSRLLFLIFLAGPPLRHERTT